MDYCAQAFVRVALPTMRGKTIVADRYIYDVLLNLALATARPLGTVLHLTGVFFKVNIIPNVVFLVDTPEEIAFRRKSDIYSMDYLRERRLAYLEMARQFGFAVLDGQSDPDGLVSEAIACCFRTTSQTEPN
jgi:thymidylate kinase